MNKENTVIFACTSLLLHVEAAQKKMGTDFPVINLDRRLHMEPEKMREQISEGLKKLPEGIGTVLVGMGFCGGSWDQIRAKQRVVIPKVDDCITILLHTDDTPPYQSEKRRTYVFQRL